MVRTALLGAMLLVFGTIASIAAPDPAEPDLVGTYKCTGTNPDGSAYEGTVDIAKVKGTYRVLWSLSDNSSVMGVGIFSGGVFAVSYFGSAPAVVVYKPEGGNLVGEWTMGGAEGAVYAETLTKVGAEPQRLVPGPRRPGPEERQPEEPKLPADTEPASFFKV